MQGMKSALLGIVVVLGPLCVLGAVSGCGDSAPVGQVQQSPEAKKADQGIQNSMKDFMQGKTQAKPKSN